MSFPVYDFRQHIAHLLVTSQIRCRFMRVEPGEAVTSCHSHDLGHEIFLVLQGRGRFEIDGDVQELGPGQLCIALADQSHRVCAVGDEPMVMYLSVTPHVLPTHTGRTDDGGRAPTRFAAPAAYEAAADATPLEQSIDRCAAATERLAEAALQSATTQRLAASELKEAMAAGDLQRAGESRRDLWEGIRVSFERMHELGEAWNALAPRIGECA